MAIRKGVDFVRSYLSRRASRRRSASKRGCNGVCVASLILLLWLVLAIIGPYLAMEPNGVNLSRILAGPSASYWLGNDDLGRSIADRLLVGAGISCLVAVVVVSISLLLGVTIGLVSAYAGGWLDSLLLILIDIVLAFPGLLLAIALAGLLGPGIENVVIALCLVSWVGYARLARAQALSVMQRDHVSAARALGTPDYTIIIRHVFPLTVAPVIVEASFGIASVVIAEAGLSFLGLGVQAPDASWGNMIRDGSRYLLVAPHMVLFPSVALLFVVIAVNRVGDSLRDRWDIRGGVLKQFR